MHCGPPNPLPCSAPHMGHGESCKFPQRGPWQSPDRSRILLYCVLAKRICIIFGSMVSIAMSGKMKANPGLGRMWYLLHGNLRHVNIIVLQTGKLIFVGSKIAVPLIFAALFGRTPRTCLRPALCPYIFGIISRDVLTCILYIRMISGKNSLTGTRKSI